MHFQTFCFFFYCCLFEVKKKRKKKKGKEVYRQKMITTATAPTSTMPAAVDVAPNLVITEERSTTMERNQPEQHNKQFLFVDENDKEELQLSSESTIPDWSEVQISKTVIDTNG